MVIDLKTYRENKEAVKALNLLNKFFCDQFPEKTWGWIGITALLFAQIAIEEYLKGNNPDTGFYAVLKSMLWDFQNKLNILQGNKGSRKP